jgi:hypothetical protein
MDKFALVTFVIAVLALIMSFYTFSGQQADIRPTWSNINGYFLCPYNLNFSHGVATFNFTFKNSGQYTGKIVVGVATDNGIVAVPDNFSNNVSIPLGDGDSQKFFIKLNGYTTVLPATFNMTIKTVISQGILPVSNSSTCSYHSVFEYNNSPASGYYADFYINSSPSSHA